MKKLLCLGRILLLFVFTAGAMAQGIADAGEDSLLARLNRLSQGISEAQALSSHIEKAQEIDREALVFRRDERIFNLAVDLNSLVRATAELPSEDPQRAEMEQRLLARMDGMGENVLQRIDEIGQRIVTQMAELESFSGARRVGAEAYLNSLHALRLQYYEVLVELIEGRQLLGLDSPELRSGLQERLYLYAEGLAGRTEFTADTLQEIRNRLEKDPANAELDSIGRGLAVVEQLYFQRLEAVVLLLERQGLDSAAYRSVLIRRGENLSLQVLSRGVVVDLLLDAWRSLRESLVAQAPNLILRLLVFLLILFVIRALSRLVKRAVAAACERPSVDMSVLLKNVLVSISGGTVMAIGILMALSQIGISLGPMLAGLGVAGFVVGFALQDTLGNFAAGGMILIYRPYDVDDFIEVAGASGLVKKMNLVSTTITTFDNQTLVVPNNKIWGDVIKNVTAQKVRRVDLEFGIGYSDDVEHAERVLHAIIDDHDKILDKPEPLIKLHALADSSVNFVVRPWTRTEDYWDVYFDVTREVKMRFDQEGISIPFPQRDVHVFKGSS